MLNGETLGIEAKTFSYAAIEQLPTLCVIGNDGSVKWTEHASPEAIMRMWGNEKFGVLALWYATGGHDRG